MDTSNSEVAIAAIGLVGLILTLVVKPLFSMMRQQNKTHEKLSLAIDKNTRAQDQVTKFMKNLNGKLEKAAIEKVKE